MDQYGKYWVIETFAHYPKLLWCTCIGLSRVSWTETQTWTKRTGGTKDKLTGRPQPHCCQHHPQEDDHADTINEKDFNIKDHSAELHSS